MNLRYANGPNPFSGTKTVALYVNGTKQSNWSLPTTGPDWKAWAFSTRNLALQAGVNQIKFAFETGTDGNVNFDALKIGETKDICTPANVEAGYLGLFDGTLESLTNWRLAGAGSFGRQADCTIRSEGGLGLLWYTRQEFTNYSLKLDWKLVKDDNGGVFVGFPNPGNDPYIAVNQGYEIQIDASDLPDRTTGAIYTFKGADSLAVAASLKPLGQWNAYEIQVQGQNIKVFLNGTLVNDFTSTEPMRDLTQGFVGVQNHGGGESIWYRNIRIKGGSIEPPPGPVVTLPGSFNSELGCPGDWQPECGAVEMTDADRDGVYEFSTNKIPAGAHEFKVAHGKSWGENYGVDGVRDGANIPLTVAAGKIVTFKYTLSTHRVEVTFANADVTAPTASVALNPSAPDWTGGVRRAGHGDAVRPGRDAGPGHARVPPRRRCVDGLLGAAGGVLAGLAHGRVPRQGRRGQRLGGRVEDVRDHDQDADRPRARGRRARDAGGPAQRADLARHVPAGRGPRLHGDRDRDGHQHRRRRRAHRRGRERDQHGQARQRHLRPGAAAPDPRGHRRVRPDRGQREPDGADRVQRAGQRRQRAARVQAVDRRQRRSPDRPVQQDADVHAVDHDAVS